MALHPNFPAETVRLRPVRVRRARSAAPRLGGARRSHATAVRPAGLDHRWLRDQRSAVAPRPPTATRAGPRRSCIDDWCQQFPSHSIGTLEFGADGALYVTGGDGASFTFTDYGQAGSPRTRAVTRRGGRDGPPALRPGRRAARAGRAHASDPTASTARCSASTRTPEQALADNPMAAAPTLTRAGSSPTGSAIRSASRSGPAPSEALGRRRRLEVWEEIDRVVGRPTARPTNFGWPCFEGNQRRRLRRAEPQPLREPLRVGRGAAAVLHATTTRATCSSYDGCADRELVDLRPARSRRPAARYPPEFDGALFFADYARSCIWVMPRGSNGLPQTGVKPSGRAPLRGRPSVRARQRPVLAPDGGRIMRIHYRKATRRRAPSSRSRRPSPFGAFQRGGIERPRPRRHDLLPVGPRRRRRLRRRDRRRRPQLPRRGHLPGPASGRRQPRRSASDSVAIRPATLGRPRRSRPTPHSPGRGERSPSQARASDDDRHPAAQLAYLGAGAAALPVDLPRA